MDNTGINLEALHSGLKAVKALRSTVLEVFQLLGDGDAAAFKEDEREKANREKFGREVQNTLANVRVRMRELETACTLLGAPNPPLNLGNSGLLSQDPAYEKTPLYSELIKAHRWFDKVAELSSQATSLFSQNSLKRTQNNPSKLFMKPGGVNFPSQTVELTTAQVMRMFPDVQIRVMKPYGASTVILVSVARTLKALIMLRGFIIDWVIVKGFNEDFYTENNKLDMWSGSRYSVFQKVTEHANAAMLHFYFPNLPDIAVKSFLVWLHSYNSLFTAPCRKCGNRLHSNMPPTWRDLRNLEVYHESCRP